MSRKLDSRTAQNARFGAPRPSYTRFPPDNPTPNGNAGVLQGFLEEISAWISDYLTLCQIGLRVIPGSRGRHKCIPSNVVASPGATMG